MWKFFEDENTVGYSHLQISTGWLDREMCLIRLQIMDHYARDSTLILGVGFLKFYLNVIYMPNKKRVILLGERNDK